MKPVMLFSVLLVTGCSSITWFGDPEPRTPPRQSPPLASYDDEEATVAALEACRTQARAMLRRDARIERDITGAPAVRGAPGLDWRTDSEDALIGNLDEFEVQQRYSRIVATCMRQRGYGDEPAEEPTP